MQTYTSAYVHHTCIYIYWYLAEFLLNVLTVLFWWIPLGIQLLYYYTLTFLLPPFSPYFHDFHRIFELPNSFERPKAEPCQVSGVL